MNPVPQRPAVPYNRAQVHTAFAKLKLTPAVRNLASQLLQLLDPDGSARVDALHVALFPMAETKSASAQLSKLLTTIGKAAEEARVAIRHEFAGEKKAGVAARKLFFVGPSSAGQADTEGLDAIPPAQLVSGQQGLALTSMRPVVLLTFNTHELHAVLEAFAPGRAAKPTDENGIPVYRLGQHGGLEVLLRHSAQGNRQSQRTVADLHAALQPLAVVAVGIAFGANADKQSLYDVLVSTFVCDYEHGKVHRGGNITLRGARPPASRYWLEAVRQVDAAPRAGVGQATWPKLHLGGLLSGEKLVDDLDYRDSLLALTGQDDIVGGEMEAVGLAQALDGHATDWIVIKAICDFADGNKSQDKEKRQQMAAHNAAHVVKALFDSGLLSYRKADDSRLPALGKEGAGYSEKAEQRRVWRAQVDDVETGAEPIPGQGAELTNLETFLADPRPKAEPDELRPKVVALDDIVAWATRPAGDAEQPLYALLGEYGMGKTTTCQRAYTLLLNRRAAGEAVPAAHYFDLRKVDLTLNSGGVPVVPTLEEAVTACLRNGYLHDAGVAPRYENVLDDIDQGAVIFFDGLDEVLARLPEQQGLTFTANLLKVLPEARRRGAPAPRVLLSCRTQFFRNLREQHSHLCGEHRGGQPASQFRALVLLPFGEPQIRAYLQAALPQSDAGELLQRIGEVHNLRELTQRPFLLKLVARFIPRLEQWRALGRTVTGATLYREMAREWLVRDKAKQSFQPEDKERLAADLAAHLAQAKRRGLTATELETWLNQWLARQDAGAAFLRKPPELLQEDFRNSTFLKRIDGADPQSSRFEFAHSSLFEFFLALHLLNALREGGPAGGAAQQRWAMARPSDETLDFLGQLLTEEPALLATMNLWLGRYLPEASEVLLAYALRAWQRGWPMPALEGADLRGAQLEGWHLGAADEEPDPQSRRLALTGARFNGAVLRRARFWQVDLGHAGFEGAALSQAEFLHCSLHGVRWAGAELGGNHFRPVAEAPAERANRSPAGALLELAHGHGGSVGACAFSADGRTVLSASDDWTLRLWDAASGALLRRFEGHEGEVQACAFSPDGSTVLSASGDGTLRLWDAASGALLRRFEGHEGEVQACAFSPDGRTVLSASDDKTLRLWDAASGALLRRFEGHQGGVQACAFSPDGRTVLSASDDKTLRLWDAASGALLRRFEGHQGGVQACAFSPDGRTVLSASNDRTLRLWDAASGALLRRFEGHEEWVQACAFSPDGRTVLSASADRTLRLWDAASGALLRRFEGHEDWVQACASSPDGRTVLSGSDDLTLRLWDAASGALLRRFEGHEEGVWACAFSPDGRTVLSASADLTLRLWDAASGALLRRFEGHGDWVLACAFSPDGRTVLSASADRTLRLWDAASGALLRRFEGHEEGVWACAFSPDGRTVLSASADRTLRLWDAAGGALLRRFEGHEDWVLACAFSPDGRTVLSASDDKTLRLWDAASGALLRRFEGHEEGVQACAFSPDGRTVLSASVDLTLRVWDAASGALLRRFEGHRDGVWACTFSPDGRTVLSASVDGTLRVWDAASGALLRRFEGHQGGVQACAFSPDGRMVLSASRDGTLRLWDATSGALLRNHLHARGAAAAWAPGGHELLHASGAAWRHLRWWAITPEHPMGGSWPLECPPAGTTVIVEPWPRQREATSA